SIQKMSNIREDGMAKGRENDLEQIREKRLVFILDECHGGIREDSDAAAFSRSDVQMIDFHDIIGVPAMACNGEII
ncbi:MAG: hypothetical protein SPL23_05850, partial [Lachnospiraceae bacterium]|nr:hypothetical protein [Lachnospiraceae bacterium]